MDGVRGICGIFLHFAVTNGVNDIFRHGSAGGDWSDKMQLEYSLLYLEM